MKVTIKITRKDVPKKKVICLHGAGMNAEAFGRQLNDYTVNFPDVEFVFLDGPMTVPIELVPEPKDNQRVWMTPYRVNDITFGMDRYYEALQKTRELLFEHWDSNCIGLIGFSQGGRVSAVLAGELNPKPKFQLLFSGVAPGRHMLEFHENRQTEIDYFNRWSGAVLHVAGREDFRSKDGLPSINDYDGFVSEKDTLWHDGDHEVPNSKTYPGTFQQTLDWLRGQLA